MEHASIEMSASARSVASSLHEEIDRELRTLKDNAHAFARLSPGQRASLVRECIPRVQAASEAWVRAACEAKGLRFDGPESSEEWLVGPMATMRNLRLLAESLERIARTGTPGPGPEAFGRTSRGQSVVKVFPSSTIDAALYGGFTAEVRFLDGVTTDEAQRRHNRGAWRIYRIVKFEYRLVNSVYPARLPVFYLLRADQSASSSITTPLSKGSRLATSISRKASPYLS